MPQLNAIGIVVSDMAKSIRFYRLLGLDVPETPDEGHVDASLPSGVRLMLDSEETVRSFRPDWRRASGNQVGLALECGAAAEVDELYAGRVLGPALRPARRPGRRAGRPVRRALALPRPPSPRHTLFTLS
jgi:catechol 2,3-dioxygenase-like lactoylglutathione lyase family enzyme